jgi:hypothetical protein
MMNEIHEKSRKKRANSEPLRVSGNEGNRVVLTCFNASFSQFEVIMVINSSSSAGTTSSLRSNLYLPLWSTTIDPPGEHIE